MLILSPKITHLPESGHIKKFPQKMDFVNFLCLLIPDLMQKIEEKTSLSI